MKKSELRKLIVSLLPKAYANVKRIETDASEYDELTKFPSLKKAIVNLLTVDFDSFLSSIEWVAPRPTTFRINLRNGQEFYLIYNDINWIAQIEGKKYHLMSPQEEGLAADSISRILRYGVKVEDEPTNDGGGEELDIEGEDI
jgi:hypothetical protein